MIKELISDEENTRLDVWLASQLEDFSRNYIQKLAKDENIKINGKVVKGKEKIKIGDIITLSIPSPKLLEVIPENIDIEIMYEDEDIIVVNKPKGMVVHPAAGNYTGTLVNALLSHCKEGLSNINGVIRPGIVHRIDKNTSGILVVAKNNISHEFLSKKFKNHDIERRYVALVHGVIKEKSGVIDAPIGRHQIERKKMTINPVSGRRAVTHFEVIEHFNKATYVELKLETGRTHQIRVHMSQMGYPIIGDDVYGRKKEIFKIEGQALHARLLGFIHPKKGTYMEFKSPPPKDFEKILEILKNSDN